MNRVDRCEVVAGSGTVIRRADSLAWASDETPDLVWDTLLSCLALGDRARGAGPLLHAFAEAVPAELAADAAFAVVVTDGTSGFVLRHGQVEVLLDGQPLQGGAVVPVAVTGRRIEAGEPDAVRALTDRASFDRHDLRQGAVAGAAFRWFAKGESPDAGAAEPSEPDPERLIEHAAPAIELADAQAEATSDPEQTEFHPPPQTDTATSPDLPRSAGVLVFEDGATANLTGDVVLGRRPEKHELVESGQAQPLVIHDPEHVLSSAHAAVRVHGEEVIVVDLDSLNGTHVAAPDARDWTKLSSGTPYVMQDGCRMLLGWTVLTYRTGTA